MSTVKVLAGKLGVSDRTIRNHQKDGYALVFNDSNKVDVEKSIHAFVKYQSEKLRQMKAQKGRDLSVTSGNTEQPKNIDDWKAEKEKQAAIKLQLQNEKDMGELVPVEAILELYNGPLSLVKNDLIDLSNQIQKRLLLDPESVKIIDNLVRESLEGLNKKGADELQPLIQEIIERHSKYYSTANEDIDNSMGDD